MWKTAHGEPNPSLIAAIRDYWWRYIRRYETEMCQRCCRPMARGIHSWYHADDPLWKRINAAWQATRGWHSAALRGAGILCPSCLTDVGRSIGIEVHWHATTDTIYLNEATDRIEWRAAETVS